jgi:signal transduction histidine kinase
VDEAPLDVAGRIAAAAAHDFNNHLAAIVLQAELVLATVEPGEEKLRRRLEGILRTCEDARGLTRSLLAFGGKRALRPVPVDVAEIVKELAGERISVSVDDARLPVEIDPDVLGEALAELVADDDEVALSASADGDVVELRVSRPGAEADGSARRRFFEPFASEDEPLSLAAVYGFVRQSGGTIVLEAAPSGGAVVVLRLPRAGD